MCRRRSARPHIDRVIPSPSMPPLHVVVVADGEPPAAVTIEGVGPDDRVADLLRAFRRPAGAGMRIDDS